jgi:cytochrome c biogenesis protein CcdA
MIDTWLSQISAQINQNMWLAPLLALFAGVLTSFTPCSLSSIPLVIAYVGGIGVEPKKALRLSLVFALGAAITFTVLGVVAASVGQLLGTGAKWWYIVLGILMVLMALQTWEVVQIIPSTYLTGKSKRRGYAGAMIIGMLGGLFSSPCATPVLVALLAIAAGSGNLLWGALLMLVYGVGHGALAVLAGSSIGGEQTRAE